MNRTIKAFLYTLTSLILACSAMIFPVLADDSLPIEKASEQGATISNEVDVASNTKPHMASDFFMYIPPDPVYEVPKMGDSRLSREQLIVSALAIGFCYLGVQAYANKTQT